MKCAVIGRFKSFFTMSFALVLAVNSCKKNNRVHYCKTCIIIKVLVVKRDFSLAKDLPYSVKGKNVIC